jgi:hypothetical protein
MGECLVHDREDEAGTSSYSSRSKIRKACSQWRVWGLVSLGSTMTNVRAKGHAQAPDDLREPRLGRGARGPVQRWEGGEPLQDGAQLDLLVDGPELVDRLLQALGDGEVPGLDDITAVGARIRLPHEEQVVELVTDEVAVALDVVLVHVEARDPAEEPLEPGDAHDRHGSSGPWSLMSS